MELGGIETTPRPHPVFLSSHTLPRPDLQTLHSPLPTTLMKRKKWTEDEELTLINKYSDLQSSGVLHRLRTREKKFQPIADHVNSLHHLLDPAAFPFRWSWRDVSVKVQNMRHQYLGVKQKIRVSDDDFNWTDGQDHWPNFFKYKQVFGDVGLDVGFGKRIGEDNQEDGCGEFYVDDVFDFDDEVGLSDGDEEGSRGKRVKRDEAIEIMMGEIMEVRELVIRREERRRENEFRKEEEEVRRYSRNLGREDRREERRKREEGMEVRAFEWEGMQSLWGRSEFRRRLRMEREFSEGRRRWMTSMDEKREEEELAWRERMVAMQIEHEKQVMHMHEVACQNQMQVLGALVGFMCQFAGSRNHGLSGLGTSAPQALHTLQHQGGLVGDNGKPTDVSSDSHFM